jgi:protein-disulfide isomerase
MVRAGAPDASSRSFPALRIRFEARSMRSIFGLLLTLLLLLAAGLAAPAGAAEPLTPEQKQAVEQVIHDYLLDHPELMIEVLHAAEAKLKEQKAAGARQEIGARRDELLHDADTPVGGNPKGDVTIVEFFDYRCPYCKEVEPALEALLREDGKIRIVYKEFPVLGPASVYAARIALAARHQGKYAAFHQAMMARKGQITEDVVLKVAADSGIDVAKAKAEMNSSEIDGLIKRNYALADALDIQYTPAFVIGDELVPGAADIDHLRALVAAARKPG